MHPANHSNIIALDVGAQRIGVAIASLPLGVAHPLRTLERKDDIYSQLTELFTTQHAAAVVVGLPRGLDGQVTPQTEATKAFVADLTKHVTAPIYTQDEAVTSVLAETELQSRDKPYAKADIDALAATYILEDFLKEHRELTHA